MNKYPNYPPRNRRPLPYRSGISAYVPMEPHVLILRYRWKLRELEMIRQICISLEKQMPRAIARWN